MIDIQPVHLAMVRNILTRFVPNREVWVFGSRVAGTAQKYSDLDLAIITDQPLDFGLLGSLRDAFSESDLPYKVDILDWATTNQEFKAIIESHHQVFMTAGGKTAHHG